jgi:hypothetical protein
MSPQLPSPKAGTNPQRNRRHPPTSESAHPVTPPDRPTPQRTVQEKFFISTAYSTITARALSFQGQLLHGVTPLQLAQNGFHYKPYGSSAGLALCFACQHFKRLNSFEGVPFQEAQLPHAVDCLWQVIYSDLKQHPETAGTPNLSTNAIPLPRQTTPRHPSSNSTPPKKTFTNASTQTPTQSSPTVPAAIEKPSNTNIDPYTQPPSATTDLEPQTAPPTYTPQPPQPIPPITSSSQNQQTTYASVLQHSIVPVPESTPPTQEPIIPAKSTLTIEDLHRRFHNKPSPFQLENQPSRRATKRAGNQKASATQSLSRFLASALPAFSRFLTEMQPNSDACCPSHSYISHSRAMRAA